MSFKNGILQRAASLAAARRILFCCGKEALYDGQEICTACWNARARKLRAAQGKPSIFEDPVAPQKHLDGPQIITAQPELFRLASAALLYRGCLHGDQIQQIAIASQVKTGRSLQADWHSVTQVMLMLVANGHARWGDFAPTQSQLVLAADSGGPPRADHAKSVSGYCWYLYSQYRATVLDGVGKPEGIAWLGL